jgi:hypothetical protein
MPIACTLTYKYLEAVDGTNVAPLTLSGIDLHLTAKRSDVAYAVGRL